MIAQPTPRAPLVAWLTGSLIIHAVILLAAPVHMPHAQPRGPEIHVSLTRPQLSSTSAPAPQKQSASLQPRRTAIAHKLPANRSAPDPPREPPRPANAAAVPAARHPEIPDVERREPPRDPAPFDLWGEVVSWAPAQAPAAASALVEAAQASLGAGLDPGHEQGEVKAPDSDYSDAGEAAAVVPPVADSAARPVYPETERRAGREGTVHLRLLVDASGVVERAVIARSSGRRSFDESARTTAERWTFHPARRGEDPIPAWILVPVEFRLEDEQLPQ